jgi:F-type H+-transporting ATPase subunit gamma
MPSLKDIRIRIGSVKTTRQVTSAMKMVSAAKFKKSHDHIIAIRPYVNKLNSILDNLVQSSEDSIATEYGQERELNKVLFVAITSNRGLCGAFNSNVIKQTEKLIASEYKLLHDKKAVDIIAIGKQGMKMLKMHGYNVIKEYNSLYNNADYASCSAISEDIMKSFVDKSYDRVVVIYNEFVNAATQEVSVNQFLPINFEADNSQSGNNDFIYEPGKEAIVKSVIPKALKTKFFRWILESIAAEHGARMTSMHKATDNASALLNDLQLVYNKARQTAITNEILEIVSGAEAQKK